MILVAALIWTLWFIFSHSMETASSSSSVSGGVQELLQEVLRRLGHPELAARLTEHMVRKAAHFCEFALEGFLLLLITFVAAGRRLLRYLSWPAFLGLLTALCDETIQLFFDGRGSQVTDIWIDFAGVTAGILFGLAVLWLWQAAFDSPREEAD